MRKSDRLNIMDRRLVEKEKFKKTIYNIYFFYKNVKNVLDFAQFFKYTSLMFMSNLRLLCLKCSYKFNLFIECAYENILINEEPNVAFKTSNILLYSDSNYKYCFENCYPRKVI